MWYRESTEPTRHTGYTRETLVFQARDKFQHNLDPHTLQIRQPSYMEHRRRRRHTCCRSPVYPRLGNTRRSSETRILFVSSFRDISDNLRNQDLVQGSVQLIAHNKKPAPVTKTNA